MIRSLSWGKPKKSNIKDYRLYLVIRVLALLSILVHIALIWIFGWKGVEPMVGFNLLSLVILVVSWNANQQNRYSTAVIFMTADVIFHSLLATILLGWNAGFYFYLLAAIPITFLNPRRYDRWLLIASLCLTMSLCLVYQMLASSVPYDLPMMILRGLNAANTVVSFAAMGLSCHYFRHGSMLTENEIYQLANTDDLTGAFNRRKMMEILTAQTSQVQRYGGKLSVMIGDLDGFKVINDSYGHLTGDRVLKETAALMQQRLRNADFMGRWGGEEFLFVLPNTNLEGAYSLAENLRLAVATQDIPVQGQSIPVSITFGVVEYHAHLSIEDTLKRADDRLYQGKQAGRNQVVI
ncbi:GGDEF domain-containing protein [Lyngbya confervoides]|uniref:GGDEF domain-containing protein n=1 Tax=Lyngbya confervoides BDU141951 TaxID=1574623 RepID=A0ABD4SZR4_9CYAN|nr:GGDEF domain-containing protein [Lyngbya confervoides]MCM1981858.1 GGDEF domain-containing protein [Lyngbya confervoides BDU141951]